MGRQTVNRCSGGAEEGEFALGTEEPTFCLESGFCGSLPVEGGG